ncbi:HAMP domain-containing histidine kinase [Billgrantia gudaonensis]|uniref:HAMP domain-containing histidine kinase n=1 Tax=Billgrantia gudaonensis TaxID=376427 RepID=A0A3S0Q1K3_9GAMM|nr:HAMP domain-containing histidine kinase [Halomonas gudaonensis]
MSHDLLQLGSMRHACSPAPDDQRRLMLSRRLVGCDRRLLKDVEALLGTLVDISRLDAGVLAPDVATFRVGELLYALAEEYRQMAAARGLALHYVASSVVVESDLALLAGWCAIFSATPSAIPNGGGCCSVVGAGATAGDRGGRYRSRHRAGPAQRSSRSFDVSVRVAWDRSLGLGLAIVDRISGMLGHPLALASRPGHGACFSVQVPTARPRH